MRSATGSSRRSPAPPGRPGWPRPVGSSPVPPLTASRCCRDTSAESWQVVHLPRIPVRFPMYLPGPRRVQVVHEEPRAAMVARIDTPLGPLTVANTHLSFVPGWNRMQLRRLIRDLRGFPGPRVLMGDLNMTPADAGRWTRHAVARRGADVPGRRARATSSTTSSPTTAHCGSTDARRRGCRSRTIARLSSTFRGPEACGRYKARDGRDRVGRLSHRDKGPVSLGR